MGNSVPTLIPHLLSNGLSAQALAQGQDYDVFVGGVPFLARITERNAYIRETAPVRREQLDVSGPGEQALAGQWIRSQSSWHGGAGLLYLDGNEDALPITKHRYEWSRGVWPFEPGQLTNLPGMSQIGSIPAGTGIVAYQLGVAVSEGASVRLISGGVVTQSLTFDSSIVSMTTDGADIIVATNTGIYAASPLSPTPTKRYDLTAGSNVLLGWAKARLMAGIDNAIYELAAPGPALPAPTYTHPTVTWTWTFIHEAPQDILVGGYAGSRSDILSFKVSDAATPVLTGGAVVATVPAGEQVLSMASISGAVMALGTSEGVRIGGWDQYYSTLTFGPLSVEVPNGVYSISSWGKYFYAAVRQYRDANDGLLVIDPGTALDKIDSPSRAWTMAHEVPGAAGDGLRVAMARGTPIVVSGTRGVFQPDENVAPVACYVQHSRVRYGTLEPKLFQLCAITGAFSSSSLLVQASSSSGESPPATTLLGSEEYQTKFKFLRDKAEWAAVRFDFVPASGKQGFLVRSWQLFSEPASMPQKVIQLPLSCADFELDARGHRTGFEGWAAKRLGALEAAEKTAAIFVIEYRNLGPVANELVTIEKISYQRTKSIPRNPGSTRDEGGTILLQVRTVR